MTSIVYASSAPVSSPSEPPTLSRVCLENVWEGADGSVWDLNDRAGGVVLGAGVEGYGLPEWADYNSESTADGVRWRGYKTKARKVEWPLWLWAPNSAAWQDLEGRWWRSFRPRDERGTWRVKAFDGTSRSLPLRILGDGPAEFDRDPQYYAWNPYSLSLLAQDPFWRGAPIGKRWATPKPVPFFGGLDGDGWLHVSRNSNAAQANLTNPGDVGTWLTVKAGGPIGAGSSITVGGGRIGLPAVPAGSLLTADTDPRHTSVLLDGDKAIRQMTEWRPRQLPPGTAVPIGIEIQGGDPGWYVEVSAPTLYWRAWG